MNRFVVVGTQRTGTTLVVTALDSHPSICCYGEIFKWRVPKGLHANKESEYFLRRRRSMIWRMHDLFWRGHLARKFIDEIYATDAAATGFKLMWNHTRRLPQVKQFILDEGISAVHVIRKNVLKTYVSRLTAEQRGVYHSTASAQRVGIVLPVEELIGKLRQIQDETEHWRSALEGRVPYLEIQYERFVEDKEVASAPLLDFLGVPQVSLQSQLRKMNPESLSNVIKNYDAVANTLKGTEFSWCLE